MSNMSTALARQSTAYPLIVAVPPIAETLVEIMLGSGRVPKDHAVHQLRRSVKCGRAQPVHHILTLLFDEADAVEVPIAAVTDVLDMMKALVEERRRLRLEATTGAHHAIEGPSLLREIQREDKAENAENYLERDVISDEDDPGKLQALLKASAHEIHEQQRRDQRIREKLARALMREACTL